MKRRAWVCWIFLISLVVVPPHLTWAADLKEAVDQLAVQLAKSVPEGRALRVAVIDFPDLQGVTSDLGRYIAERLTTRLSAQTQKFRVIERRRLGQVLGELRFSISDLVDPDKAKQLGKMLGVEAIVVGTVSDLVNMVDVDARIIEIETNNIFPGMTAAISKDDTVRQMMERGREMPSPPSAGAAPMASTPAVGLGTVKYQEFPQFRIEVAALRVLTGNMIELVLNYVNKTQKEFLLGLPGGCSNTTTMSDDAGNDYQCSDTTGIGQVWETLRKYVHALRLPPGSSSTASFRFRPRSEVARKGSRFSFNSTQRLFVLVESGGPNVEAGYSISISILNIEPR